MELSNSHKISQEKRDFKISDVLITAWSRVQVLPGPPKKHEGSGLRASFLLIRTVPCSFGCESLCAACHRPACRLQEWYWAVRVRLLRLPLPHRYWDWTSRCSRRCAGTYADGFFRLGVHITEHMIRWPFLFAPIAADPAFCRKLHQIPPFAQ